MNRSTQYARLVRALRIKAMTTMEGWHAFV